MNHFILIKVAKSFLYLKMSLADTSDVLIKHICHCTNERLTPRRGVRIFNSPLAGPFFLLLFFLYYNIISHEECSIAESAQVHRG